MIMYNNLVTVNPNESVVQKLVTDLVKPKKSTGYFLFKIC